MHACPSPDGRPRGPVGPGLGRLLLCLLLPAASACTDDTLAGGLSSTNTTPDAQGSPHDAGGAGDAGTVDGGPAESGIASDAIVLEDTVDVAEVGADDGAGEVSDGIEAADAASGPDNGVADVGDGGAAGDGVEEGDGPPEVAPAVTLCDPCTESSACHGGGCVDHGPAGFFCGTDCQADGDCEAGFRCVVVTSAEGLKLQHCVPTPAVAGGPPGACVCSPSAVAAKLQTSCYIPSLDDSGAEIGRCKGARRCGEAGLSACSAPEPGAETCDGEDDDCDGKTDEKSCDDGDFCTIDQCHQGGCVHHAIPGCGNACNQDADCKDDGDPCTEVRCDTKAAKCMTEPVAGACDDGDKCTGAGAQSDTCKDGTCAPGPLKGCDDDNGCTTDACDPANGLCAHHPVQDGVACDDGNPCSITSGCKSGGCAAGPLKGCDDGDACTTDGCDPGSGSCQHEAISGCGASCKDDGDCKNDGNPCTQPLCGSGGTCTVAPVSGPCDDGKPCTAPDTCKDGGCGGAPRDCDDGNPCTADTCASASGTCEHKAVAASCNDGDPCTVGEACATTGSGAGTCGGGKAKDCADANPCTSDACAAGSGLCTHIPTAGACDDGNPCTAGDNCATDSAGRAVCAPGAATSCDDGDPCTADTCVPATGGCGHAPIPGCGAGCKADGECKPTGKPCTEAVCHAGQCVARDRAAPCDDGDKCTIGDACKAGKCAPAGPLACDDGKPCTVDRCDPVTGKCTADKATDGSACSDDDPCTTADACTGGQCAGKAKNCDDGKPCTLDRCHPGNGQCQHAPAKEGAACDDGDKCTAVDGCTAGTCKGKAKDCDDGDKCTFDGCDDQSGVCGHIAVIGCGGNCVIDKDCKQDANPCTVNVCAAGQGKCGPQYTGGACSDGDPCTVGDTCLAAGDHAGTCAGGAKVCDDGNACTTDACDAATGGCVAKPVPNDRACADGDACTEADRCVSGVCTAGAPRKCDDGNVCTTDACDPRTGLCAATAVGDGAACDDGKPCTLGDTCKAGACTSGPPKSCTDGDACTTDTCDARTGACGSAPIPGCGGHCKGDKDCKQDGDVCTMAVCELGAGGAGKCASRSRPGTCDDGDGCTVKDTCNGGHCQGSARSCDDGSPCTLDTCAGGKGEAGQCRHAPAPAGTGCTDGKPCSVGDACKAGKCVPGVLKRCVGGSACVLGACDAATGDCAFKPAATGSACSDANACTTGDKCAAGKCIPGPAKDCKDGDACTTDACDPATGKCANTKVPGCGGFCLHDAHCPPDGNPCTRAFCMVADKTCAVKLVDAKCNDGDGCTALDACVAGRCVGKRRACDDHDPCTADSCPTTTGHCRHLAVGDNIACTDGDACTGGDTCHDGHCTPATHKNCDDGNGCTLDACSKTTGECRHLPRGDGTACNDGDLCSTGDACRGGSCAPGTGVTCDDGKPCTADACVVATGQCASTPIAGCGGNCQVDADCKPDANPCTRASCAPSAGSGDGARRCATGNLAEGTACSDGKPCTAGDACSGSQCVGKPKDCDDHNLCTADRCNATTGGCEHHGLGDTTVCSDGNACTTADRCKDGACRGGPARLCDDHNPCTTEVCNKTTGNCDPGSAPKGAPCSDHNPCTGPDGCSGAGRCRPGAHKSCTDGDPCTTDACDLATGHCTSTPVAGCGAYCEVNGDCKQDGNPCTTAYCHAATRKCRIFHNGGGCTDGDPCTVGDRCSGGVCTAVPKKCDDHNPCTLGYCAASIGACVQKAVSAGIGCDDGNPCTTGERCVSGVCGHGGKRDCDDANPCTYDACNKSTGQCQHANLPGGSGCSDGLFCTVGDTCKGGTCKRGKPRSCDDGEPCTDDSCREDQRKCVFAAKPGCGGLCKLDGDCKEDANPCTTAYCNPVTRACSFKNRSGACHDANPCTYSDRCAGAKCAGTTRACGDGNPCTLDRCDPTDGSCKHAAGPDGQVCHDGDGCTVTDRCKAGHCAGTPRNCDDGNVCTTESCNKSTGLCQFGPTKTGTPCSDHNPCTQKESCKDGTCSVSEPKSCDDGDACTADSCNPAGGACRHKAILGCGGHCSKKSHCKQDGNACTRNVCNLSTKKCESSSVGGPCSDHNACTTGDTCQAGVCGGVHKDCGDANPCTNDGCRATTGACLHLPRPNGAGCHDGDPCTYADRCDGGVCSGTGMNCDDSNSCTLDTCDAASGACKHQAIPGCGGNCTHNSQCKQDGNPCRANVCDLGLGKCIVKNRNAACGDGDPCTLKDRCEAGVCKPGPVRTCNDHNACTKDYCDSQDGQCKAAPIAACKPCKNSLQCDDTRPCTEDVCDAGRCRNTAISDCKLCKSFKDCDDGTICTSDSCIGGRCSYLTNPVCVPCKTASECQDGNPCTRDICYQGGFCVNLPIGGCVPCISTKDCDDGNPCTTDACKGHRCVFAPIPGCK